jgi:hypothetical protein
MRFLTGTRFSAHARAVLFSAACLFGSSSIYGQGLPASVKGLDPHFFVVIQVDSLPDGLVADVVRRPDAFAPNVIRVTKSTTPPELARAVTTLYASRVSRPTVVHELHGFIRKMASGEQPRVKANADLAAKDLIRLRSARVINIAGIGKGPFIIVSAR